MRILIVVLYVCMSALSVCRAETLNRGIESTVNTRIQASGYFAHLWGQNTGPTWGHINDDHNGHQTATVHTITVTSNIDPNTIKDCAGNVVDYRPTVTLSINGNTNAGTKFQQKMDWGVNRPEVVLWTDDHVFYDVRYPTLASLNTQCVYWEGSDTPEFTVVLDQTPNFGVLTMITQPFKNTPRTIDVAWNPMSITIKNGQTEKSKFKATSNYDITPVTGELSLTFVGDNCYGIDVYKNSNKLGSGANAINGIDLAASETEFQFKLNNIAPNGNWQCDVAGTITVD